MLGIYPLLSNEDYHAHDSVSRSKLMDFDVSPYNYWALHLAPNRPNREATPAMILGTAFHSMVLEHDLFHKQYVIMPKPVFLKDVGRAAYDQYKSDLAEIECGHRIPLTRDQYDILLSMYSTLYDDSRAIDLIQGAIYEQSYFWEDKESGLLVKSRPDILHQNIIVDLKTCADASPRAFQSAMVKGGYHIQAAMIRDGIRRLEGRDISNVINIAIETKYPYAIGIYVIDEEALDYGEFHYKDLLKRLKHANMNNDYPSYEIQSINLPRWAL